MRLRWFSGYIGYALMLVVPIVNVELSRAAGSVVSLIVMGTAYLYAITVILKNRDLMGATNPKEAEAGTIRADFASSIDANAVHGSDSAASAEREIAYFFNDNEICPRG